MHFRIIAVAALAAACFAPLVTAEEGSTQGTLIWRDDSRFFFFLKTPEGLGLYEFLGGPSPMVGHVFEGKLPGFCGRKLMNVTEGKPTMVYSETFDLPKSLTDKKIPRQCKRKNEFEAIAG